MNGFQRPLRAGMAVGLLGGSFDPPHRGHVHITLEALKRLRLDRVWWLVSPGNPLKTAGPAPFSKRMAACRAIMQHPRVEISDFEARHGTRYTAETLLALKRQYQGVRFVWLMGADNLAQFHLWQNWRAIMEMVPVGVMARPEERLSGLHSPAAARYERYRLPAAQARLLSSRRPPVWCFLNVPMVGLSSSEIRARGEWVAGAWQGSAQRVNSAS